jgi:DNA-binding transcriptional LysR family regulator
MVQSMDLRQLSIFREVAAKLSFTKAAASLNYVQSNVTSQIQALEKELGVKEIDHEGGPGDEILAIEPVWIVAAPDHLFVEQEVVVPSDFAGVDLLLTETGCCYRVRFERILSRANVYPKIILEFNSIEAVKRCVISGLGVSLLSAVSVSSEISSGQLVKLPWSGPDLSVATHLVWHKDKWISPSLDAFLTLAREMLIIRG